jgi:hypothetical protein
LRSNIRWLWALHDFASPRASFATTPCASSRSYRNSNRVLRSKPENRPTVVLRPKPPNCPETRIRYASSTISTRAPSSSTVLTKSSCTAILIWSIWSTPPHVLLRVEVPSVSHPWPVFQPSWSLDPNFTSVLHHSGPLHWYDPSLLDLQHACRPSLCSTPAHEHMQETCCTHTHAWVSRKLNRSLDRLSTITHQNSAHKGIYEPSVRKTEDQEWKMKDERPAKGVPDLKGKELQL